MQVLHPQNKASKNKPHPHLTQLLELLHPLTLRVADERVNITSRGPLHDEIEIGVILECVVEGGDEGTVRLLQDSLLKPTAISQFTTKHLSLYDPFDGILLQNTLFLILFQLSEKHFTKSATSDPMCHFKTVPFDFLIRWKWIDLL